MGKLEAWSVIDGSESVYSTDIFDHERNYEFSQENSSGTIYH